ncbi:ATP-binding protein [Marinicella rhabdoformis]|uniref:ATP-binding protein n=1 Tax=Marinicella rhabdoformis TaxID=2580566 RepID=UPI0012AECCE1|nr:ATP-binding protein [Marinicella rhabdoformis]
MGFSPKNRSLTKVVLLVSNTVLLLALAVVGLVMAQAFKEKTLHIVKERLESYVEALLPDLEIIEGQLVFPEQLPTPRLNQPGSGMYAEIIAVNEYWHSPSAIGQNLPKAVRVSTNQRLFESPLEYQGERLFRLSQGVEIESEQTSELVTIILTEHAGNFYEELWEFEETLLSWLLGISLFLLVMQWLTMVWATKPLKKLTQDLALLEKGDSLIFSENYPTELMGLTSSLNRLIANERNHLERQRKTLGDLAHSLKTPLAVIQSELGTDESDKDVIQQQLNHMNEIVAYQLKKAAVAGHRTFTQGVPVIDLLDKIIQTLQKIHKNKNISVDTQIAPGAIFYGEKGDLLELLGNLLENAFKWCDQHVKVTIKTLFVEGRQRTGLKINIADDGPGIPENKRLVLLQRGVRGDEKVLGHGIGLSIVSDIVDSYQGQMAISEDEQFKGACFKITLPP